VRTSTLSKRSDGFHRSSLPLLFSTRLNPDARRRTAQRVRGLATRLLLLRALSRCLRTTLSRTA
jgi:hypothetical protein